MLMFTLIVFLWYVHFILEMKEYMLFIKKYWRELFIVILIITVVILSVIIGKNPSGKQYNQQNKVIDSLIEISVRAQKEFADTGRIKLLLADSLNKHTDTFYILIHKTKKEKDEAIEIINNLSHDAVYKLYDSLATEYRLSKERTPK